MSLTSLANDELKRSEGLVLRARSKGRLVQGAIALASKHAVNAGALPEFINEVVENDAPVREEEAVSANALESLVKYIPTESVTLYLAATSASGSLLVVMPFFTPSFSYWFFAALTPILFLLILAAKRKAQRFTPLLKPRQWPWWKLTASLVAFLAWGLAVPSSPYSSDGLRGAAVAFCALFISTILGLLEGIFETEPSVE